MKKLLLVISLFFAVVSISNAQSKKGDDPTINQIDTNSALFELVIGGTSRDSTALRILVTDRVRQYVAMENARVRAKSRESDPVNYWVRLIHAPEIDPLAFRQAETLEENRLPIDGITVLAIRFKDLQEAALTWYGK